MYPYKFGTSYVFNKHLLNDKSKEEFTRRKKYTHTHTPREEEEKQMASDLFNNQEQNKRKKENRQYTYRNSTLAIANNAQFVLR